MPNSFLALLDLLASGSSDRGCSRRHVLQLLGALGVLPLLEGCSRPTLKIAAHPWPGYELLFLARREGWLPEKQVQLLETSSATDSLQALVQGRADAAALTLDEVLEARGNGMALTAVLVFDLSAGADLVMARSSISSIKKLAGKRIGVEQSALGALMLQLTLQAAGLDQHQIVVVALTPDRHLEAWQSQQLDAVITYEPIATKLLSKGAQIIYDSRSMPGMIFDVLAVKTDSLKSLAGGLKGAIRGHFRALEQLQHNPHDAAYRLSERLKLSPGQVLDSFRGLELPSLQANQRYLGGTAPAILTAARVLHDLMLAQGRLKRPDNLNNLISHACLPVEG